MTQILQIIKGLNLNIPVSVTTSIIKRIKSHCNAIIPDDYIGVIQKLVVKGGDLINTGQVLYHPRDIEYYRCVPVPMSNAAQKMLCNLGVPNENLHYDNFGA